MSDDPVADAPKKPTEDVLDLLHKLIRTRDNPASAPNEIEFAAKRIISLQFEYNISEAALSKSEQRDVIKEGEIQSKGGKRYKWQQKLLSGLCSICFCKVFEAYDSYRQNGMFHAVIIGQEQDIEVVRYLHAYIAREIQRLGNRAFREAQRLGTAECKWPATWMEDYGPGAVEGILEKLRVERAREEQEAPEGSTALIVHREAMVEDFISMKRHGMTVAEREAFDAACTEAYQYGSDSAGHIEGEEELSDEALSALRHLYTDERVLRQFDYGWDSVMNNRTWEREQAAKTQKDLNRPRHGGGHRTRSYRTYYEGPGRKEHKVSDDAFHQGKRDAKEKIQIREGIAETSSDDKSPRRIGG